MRVRWIGILTALLLAAPMLEASQRRAQPRTGGGSSASSGRSSGGGSRAQAGDRRSSSETRHARPSGATARHPRAGTGTGYRGRGYSYRYGLHHPYYPGWGYDSYYGGYGYPYYGWGLGYDLGYRYAGFPYGYRVGVVTYVAPAYPSAPSMRVMVDPPNTRVYVDGHYAGVTDDFDGLFQRLYVAPGRREVRLELEGHATHSIQIDVPPGSEIKVRHTMQRGGSPTVDDQTDGREAPVYAAAPPPRSSKAPSERDLRYERGDAAPTAPATSATPQVVVSTDDVSRLQLQVTPEDASVYIDGSFHGTGGALLGSILELEPGPHRIEIVRPGLRSYERAVTLEARERRELSVTLEPGP
jgi:hypothetical protein